MRTVLNSLIFGLSVALGAMIWLLSPLFTGKEEPWDAEWAYYPLALVIAGFVPTCFSARQFPLWAAGTLLGQLIGFVYNIQFPTQPPVGANLWPLGLVFLCAYSLLSLAGAVLGAGAHRILYRLFCRRSNSNAA